MNEKIDRLLKEYLNNDKYESNQKNILDNFVKELKNKLKTNKTTLSEETIENIKTIVSEKEIIDPKIIEQLEDRKIKTAKDDSVLADIYLTVYDLMNNNSNRLDGDSEDEKFSKKIKNYLKQFEIKEIRKIMKDYRFGENMGDHYREKDIRKIVDENRESMEELINVFFRIFGEIM